MKEWDEIKDEVRGVAKDKEIARSLLKTVGVRFEALKVLAEKDSDKFASILTEGYYEILKELITAIMSIDGYKTTSHEALVIYLGKFYKDFDNYEVVFIDDLRKIRNKIGYKGFSVNPDYIKRNKLEIQNVIKKMKGLLEKKLI